MAGLQITSLGPNKMKNLFVQSQARTCPCAYKDRLDFKKDCAYKAAYLSKAISKKVRYINSQSQSQFLFKLTQNNSNE